MPQLLILKTGDAFPEVVREHGDFEDLFLQALTADGFSARVFDARSAEPLPALATIAGIYITGSPSMVTTAEPWSEALKPWLREALAADVPMLGVCYGHQLMAAAFGGVSDYHPAGRESGTLPVALTIAGREDPLLGQLPAHFSAHLTHAQAVMKAPENAQILAGNSHDPHQALRYGPRQWSVQFHPEFTAPVMKAYLQRQYEELKSLGQNPEALLQAVADTPEARDLLTTFATLALGQASAADLKS